MLKVDEFFFPKLTNRPSKSSDAGEGTKTERRSKAGFCAASRVGREKETEKIRFSVVGNVKGGERGEAFEEERKADERGVARGATRLERDRAEEREKESATTRRKLRSKVEERERRKEKCDLYCAHTHARLGFPYHRNWPVTRARWPRRRRANDIYHRSVVARYTHFRIYRAKKGRKGHGRYLQASASRDFAVRGSYKFLFRFYFVRLSLPPPLLRFFDDFLPFFFTPLSGNPRPQHPRHGFGNQGE